MILKNFVATEKDMLAKNKNSATGIKIRDIP